jgi:hypothetical protein
MQTDGRTGMTKLIVTFHGFSKALKMGCADVNLIEQVQGRVAVVSKVMNRPDVPIYIHSTANVLTS